MISTSEKIYYTCAGAVANRSDLSGFGQRRGAHVEKWGPRQSGIDDDIKRDRFQEAFTHLKHSNFFCYAISFKYLWRTNSCWSVVKFSKTWSSLWLQNSSEEEIFSWEFSVVYTYTPIFLQANMADYGAQGGYGGGYGGDQGGYQQQDPNLVGGGQGGYDQQQGGYQQQDPNLVGGGQGGYDQQQAGGYDQDAIKQQRFVRSVAAACFSHRFDITHLLLLSIPPLIKFYLFALSCLGSCNHLHNRID